MNSLASFPGFTMLQGKGALYRTQAMPAQHQNPVLQTQEPAKLHVSAIAVASDVKRARRTGADTNFTVCSR
jgi:hypothetical protein